MAMKQQVGWREPYVSAGLNRKLAGILPAGIYQGFGVYAKSGMTVEVRPEATEYPHSVAVVDRNGYNFTVTGDSAEDVAVPEGSSGVRYIVLDALYQEQGGGYQELSVVSESGIQPYHVVLARLTIPEGTTIILNSMIDYIGRTFGEIGGRQM
jgi:hypothetical protein